MNLTRKILLLSGCVLAGISMALPGGYPYTKEMSVLQAKSKKIKNTTLCTDSDSAKRRPKYTKGIVVSKIQGTYYDKCTANYTRVQEAWCYEDGSGRVGTMIYNCRNGCKNGACKR